MSKIELNGREFESIDDFYNAQAEYWKKNSKAKPKAVECLNLLMKKDYALQILHGEKKLEFRAYTQHFVDRVIDKDVDNYMADNPDNEDLQTFGDVIRPVKRIRFHNYNNSWHLEVECTNNFLMAVTKDAVDNIQKQFGCHDMDDMLADLERKRAKDRPMFFVFVCGDVLDTDLK